MSSNQFEAILYAMSFMKDEAPLYVDKFWCVWRLIDAWNENMNENFNQDGSHAWMNQCRHGLTNLHAQALCLYHESHGLLEMNTIPFVVVFQVSYLTWS